jgi:branched-chain amino acid transport system substrate-binding protein
MKKQSGLGRNLFVALVAVLVAVGFAISAPAEEPKPIKIGVVTFLSGPAAGPFGVPARNGAEILVEALNAGGKIQGYATKGLGGAPIELVYLDEAGGTTKQVTEYRNLVQRQNVDLVIGYISSGDTLAIAPVAEELKKLTVFFDSGTPRIFEDASYKYVFRTGSHSTMDSVGAALYVTEMKPNIKKYAGINQNYAWGQDSWSDFEAAMKILAPKAKVVTSQMTKLMSGQFGAEISVLLSSGAEVIHSSFWGGDTESFVLQAAPRGLFKKSTVVLTCGEHIMYRLGNKIPDGTVLGGKGTVGVFAPKSEINNWFQKVYSERYDVPPTYPSYRMVQAFLGVKSAYEKAMAANKGAAPTQDQVIAAFEHLSFDTPSGIVEMGLGKGHQAVTGISYGTTKVVKGKLTITNIKTYPKEKVNPPEGVLSKDWIESGFKRTK